MGIHGEPGREQQQLPETGAADYVADTMLSTIIGKHTFICKYPIDDYK